MVRVKDIMTSSVKAIDATASLTEAFKFMQAHHIKHLPVLEGDKLVGIVSDRDLLSHASKESGALVFPRQAIETIMSSDVVSCQPDSSIEDALRLVLSHEINSLMVMDNKKVAGIVTSKDILRNLRISDN